MSEQEIIIEEIEDENEVLPLSDDEFVSKLENLDALAVDGPKIPDNDEVITELKKKIETEQRNAEQERKQRLEAEKRVVEKDAAVTDSQYSLIVNALSVEQVKVLQLNQAKREAIMSGDADRVIEIDDELYSSRDKIKEMSAGKQWLEAQAERAKNAPQVQLPEDPVDRFIVQYGKSGRDAEWIRGHADLVKSESGLRKLSAMHEMAVNVEGLQPGTDGYYDYLTNIAAGGKLTQVVSGPAKKYEQGKVMTSAPVSKESVSTSKANTDKASIKMTATEKRLMDNMISDGRVTKEEYLKSFIASKNMKERGQ